MEPKHMNEESNIMKTHEQIQGWYDWENLINELILPLNARYLEVGVWRGKSLVDFLQKTEALKTTALGIDLFGGKQDDSFMDSIVEELGGDFMNETLQNLADAGVSGRVELIKSDSKKAAPKLEDQSFDVILIDALHTFDSVFQDTKAYWPKLKVGGIMMWHDADRKEVIGAIRAFGLKPSISKPRTAWMVKHA